MNVSIVMPYRDLGCPYRARAYEFVSAYWSHHLPDAELVVEGGPEPFNLSVALNMGVERAKGDVLFEIGPDGIVTPESVRRATVLAAESDGLVTCQDRNFHLTLEATTTLLAMDVDADFGVFDASDCEYSGTTSADIGCFSRATWEAAGGFEERFGAWGGVDSAYALACDTLVAPGRRIPGTWIHLWHPHQPQSYPGTPGYLAQFTLLSEYVEAAKEGRAAMQQLVESR